MSYCVNCGVELHPTASKCPLCDTEVINPKYPVDQTSPTPYPNTKGQVDRVSKRDSIILLSSIFGSTALACGLLNIFILNKSAWSVYIIGACIMLWICIVPALAIRKLPYYANLLLDGAAVSIYIYLISLQFPGSDWFGRFAFPIIAILDLLLILFVYCRRTISSSTLVSGIYLCIGIGIYCAFIDFMIHLYFFAESTISWSAIVLSCCAVTSIVLITIVTRSKLRDEVRRRAHF